MTPATIGPYQVRQHLAQGGMAEIFLATKEGPLGFLKPVVIKQIDPSLAQDPGARSLFFKEATLHAQLTHPNVVQLFDLQSDRDALFMVLEWVRGASLREMAPAFGELPEEMRIGYGLLIAIDIASALDYVHNFRTPAEGPLGLIHGDVCASNILISDSGSAKLCDFGLATSWRDPPGHLGLASGHIRYMAPEQMEGRPLEPRSDLFGLGASLFECLSGVPLQIGSSEEICRSLRAGTYLNRLNLLNQMPREVIDLVQRALEPSPANRFVSARAFWLAAKQVLARMERQHGVMPLQDFTSTEEAPPALAEIAIDNEESDAEPDHPKRWSRALSSGLLAPFSIAERITLPIRQRRARDSGSESTIEVEF